MKATRLVLLWAGAGLTALLGGPYLPIRTQIWLATSLAVAAGLVCLIRLVHD
jgi:hypothetical protein